MKLTGPKMESIYRRYAIVSEADLAEGMRKVATLQASSVSAVDRVNAGISGGAALRSSTIGAGWECWAGARGARNSLGSWCRRGDSNPHGV